MSKPEFPAKLQFLPKKRPCKNVSFYTETLKNSIVLEWVPGDSSETIKASDFERFLSDTKTLLKTYSDVCFFAISKINNSNEIKKMESLTLSYWGEWGPIILTKSNSIRIDELLFLGYWYYILRIFWSESTDLEFIPLQGLFNNIKAQSLSEPAGDSSRSPMYWYPFFDFTGDRLVTWVPLSKKPSEFMLLFKHPAQKDLNRLEFGTGRIDWVKQNILQNIANYISRHKLFFEASVRGNEIHFTGCTTDLFLAFLVNEVVVTKQKGIEYCHCGCGKPIPPGRKFYATDKCDQNRPKKRIANWLGTMKSREQLSKQEYDLLMNQTDELISDGKSEQEIRKIIKAEADKFKTAKKEV